MNTQEVWVLESEPKMVSLSFAYWWKEISTEFIVDWTPTDDRIIEWVKKAIWVDPINMEELEIIDVDLRECPIKEKTTNNLLDWFDLELASRVNTVLSGQTH